MKPSAPITWQLADLLEGMDYVGELPDVTVSGITLDSRDVESGDLFLACQGHQGHGLDFLPQALARGVGAVLAEISPNWLPETIHSLSTVNVPVIAVPELSVRASYVAGRFYGEPSHQLLVVGITGTNGKTSCTQFIANAFPGSADGQRRAGVLGTLGNGFPGQLQTASHTTMDPVSVQAALASLLEQQAELVAMEVSSHALKQGRVADVRFSMAVLTNFSRDHLDYHGTMANYANAKSLLFRMPGLRAALVNADDELGQRLIEELADVPVRLVTFGRSEPDPRVDGWLRVVQVDAQVDGLACQLASSWGDATFKLEVLGRFNLDNALVALGVMLETGMSLEESVVAFQQLRTVPGRMEVLRASQGPTVVVDYAHTPDALEQVLLALREHSQGALVCVFGCGGDRDRGKRPQMGEIAARLADRVVLTDDNPRHEEAASIIQDILAGMQKLDHVVIEQNRADAIRLAVGDSIDGDLVLIAGKGHEDYQQVGDERLPFSDQQVVRDLLGMAA